MPNFCHFLKLFTALQCQLVKFGKFEEQLTATQSMSYYLKCNMCNKKETHIGKAIGNNTKRYEVKINQQISDCKTAVSTCKFRRHVYDCGIKNNCLEEPFFSFMFRLSKSDRLEAIEKHFHSKDHDTTSNSSRN